MSKADLEHKSMMTQKTAAGYIVVIFVILITLLLGYQLGKANQVTNTIELNSILLELLTRRSNLPLKDIELHRVEYGDMSYSPFNFETNILDYAYIQFSGMYIPTGKHFSLRHHINIYKPGNVPEITATETLYNDSIAH